MEKPTVIVWGPFRCPACGRMRKTNLGQWACLQLHKAN